MMQFIMISLSLKTSDSEAGTIRFVETPGV